MTTREEPEVEEHCTSSDFQGMPSSNPFVTRVVYKRKNDRNIRRRFFTKWIKQGKVSTNGNTSLLLVRSIVGMRQRQFGFYNEKLN